MFIELTSNNGYQYLKLAHNVSVSRDDGTRTIRKKNIFNIGPLSRFDDGQPNYLARLRESFRAGKPLIDALLPYVENENLPKESYGKALEYGDPNTLSETKLFGHTLIERYIEELGLATFFRQYKHHSKINYDVLGFLRLLVYGRILNPQSKIATFEQNDDYYRPITDDEYKFHIYDTLDFIQHYKHGIVNKINQNLIKKFNRTTNKIYYDLTNFFFEIEEPDDDVELDDGTIEKGLRKMGVSKENRKQPIVQMGLFMDDQGIPISIEIFPGNTLDSHTVIPALSNSIDKLDTSKYIFVADRGIASNKNAYHLRQQNKGYVISKSIAKSSSKEKQWIYDPKDYIKVSNGFKYKSTTYNRSITDPISGNTVTFPEKVVVYWSKKFYDREIAQHKSFLDFIKSYNEKPANFRLSKTNSSLLKKFLKDDVINTKTGEVIKSSDIITLIDMDKVTKFESEMGFYQLVTSEIDMNDLEVIDTYKGLTKIENEFRIMKGSLETRPLYVRTKEHIESHLIICMIALTIIRLMQNKVDAYKKQHDLYSQKEKNRKWNFGMSSKKLKTALNNWILDTMGDDYFKMCNTKTDDLTLLLKAYDITIEPKYYRPNELKALKTNIQIF